jgi:hypothetical protein
MIPRYSQSNRDSLVVDAIVVLVGNQATAMGSAAQGLLVPALYESASSSFCYVFGKFNSFWKVPIPAPNEILHPINVWLRVPIL